MARQFHSKSRFGCTVCKKRRVKVDERQPICRGCARLRLECNYSHPRPSTTPESTSSTPLSMSLELEQSVSHVAEDHSASQSRPGFDLLDLTLMHHYATNTCQHLFTGDRQAQVWQHYIPNLGASNGVLMHGILAVTALHQAWKNPLDRDLYRTRALHHHGIGLPLFKSMVASASPETAEIIVAYVILLGIWIYASPDMTREQLSLDDVLSTVETVRTGRSVFHIYRDVVITTPIGIFLIPPCREPLLGRQVSLAHEALETLRKQVENPSEGKAVGHLQMLMDRYLAGADHTRSAAGWMASVGEDYWARLRGHHPHALLIFAYSCLLAYASEHACWWLTGWSERILLACSKALSPADKETINWDSHEQLIRTLGVELASLAKHRDEKSG
ncbi:hypothetical protein BDV96DRAFT_582242 [Lophiotrema nucula]|uniref:Zn(2)-C6 fungal-type domain-containing protein n=1 Tax=Lophiotrema nucula TaxID=690887 RepID=A0A6A5YXA9_9PLEO|nr:hypothetical protein BDV96DRAFT_582242 [Lophiotrema nucula]